MRKYLILFFVSCSGLAFTGLWQDYFDLPYPEHFPVPIYDFTNNPLTLEKVLLGRVLFYDPILSRDGTISCASCHSSYNAFAHTDHDLSHGIDDIIGNRNAPPLFNLAWRQDFMWDGAVNHLDMQALAPLTHPGEMGEELERVISKLRAEGRYRKLFLQAFQDSTITGEHLLKALAQFQLTLVSASAKYDLVKQHETNFSPQEERGYSLFSQHCNVCHTEPLFTNTGFADNGLPVDTFLRDHGRGAVTQLTADSLHFRVPSLRNLSYTHPYMHDGRFRKLKEVLRHYTEGILVRESLSKELSVPIELTSNEQADLIAFLLTLNDQAFVFEPKHQFPRKYLLPSAGF